MSRPGIVLLSLFALLSSQLASQILLPPRTGVWPEADRPAKSDASSLNLIAAHLKARGGTEALKAVGGLHCKGTLTRQLQTFSLESWHDPLGNGRLEQARTHLGWDYLTAWGIYGESVWEKHYLPDDRNPDPMTGLRAQTLRFEAGLPFLFLDHAGKGHVFSYRGEVFFAKRKAHLIHAWLASGLQMDIHFDSRTLHVLNYRYAAEFAGIKRLVDRLPTGLKKVDGIWWDLGYSVRVDGDIIETITFEQISVIDEPPEPSRFTTPPSREIWLRGE
jgi:hypothetical protein